MAVGLRFIVDLLRLASRFETSGWRRDGRGLGLLTRVNLAVWMNPPILHMGDPEELSQAWLLSGCLSIYQIFGR